MTGHVTPSSQGPLPMVGSGSVRQTLIALERLGYDGERLLAAARVSRAQIEDPDALVSCSVPVVLYAAAQQQRPHTSLALQVALATPLGAWPLVDYLALSSETVGNALRQLSRYHRLIGAPAPFQFVAEDDVVQMRMTTEAEPAALFEFGVAIPLVRLREETVGRARPQSISFVHHPADPAAFEATFACPVHAGAGWTGFTLTRASWEWPLKRRDPILLGVLERHADEVVARLPSMDALVPSVRRTLASAIARGAGTMEEVARALALTPRTLQRRLADEGTTFQQLLEDLRRESAARHLGESELSIAEISFLLGYSEPAAFHRAFRRWYRLTPQAFRAERRERGEGVRGIAR